MRHPNQRGGAAKKLKATQLVTHETLWAKPDDPSPVVPTRQRHPTIVH